MSSGGDNYTCPACGSCNHIPADRRICLESHEPAVQKYAQHQADKIKLLTTEVDRLRDWQRQAMKICPFCGLPIDQPAPSSGAGCGDCPGDHAILE